MTEYRLHWTPFYQELGRNGPRLLTDVRRDLFASIEYESRESDAFYSEGLQGLFLAHDDDAEVAVRRCLEQWLHTVRKYYVDLLGEDSVFPWDTVGYDERDKRRMRRAVERIGIRLDRPEFDALVLAASLGIRSVPTTVGLLVQAVVQPIGKCSDGEIVRAIGVPWRVVARNLAENWHHAFSIDSRKWEEMIAGAFEQDGFDEVILTPRSADRGRDLIAVKRGVCSVRIVGSVKAYSAGRHVRHDDVRALMGVLSADPQASKGIVTTTSTFAPRIREDPLIASMLPYRLELLDGGDLQSWFRRLTSKAR